MMPEMDDVMVLESLLPYPKDLDKSVLAARARERQEVVLGTGVTDIYVDSRASDAKEVTEQVVGMEKSSPALTHSHVGDDMSKHGDGPRPDFAQEQELAIPLKPSEVVLPREQPFESSSFSSLGSGNFTAIAVDGTAVAQKKCRIRGKNWGQKDTDALLEAVSNSPKVHTRMEQGTDSVPYWDAVATAVPSRTGHECRGRMDTLKRSFSTIQKYCDGHRKEFKDLNEKDFGEVKVSPRFSEAWYNQIHDYCPPRPKKKLKTNGAGASPKSVGFVSETSTEGLLPPVLGEPALVAPGPVPQPTEDPPAYQVADPLDGPQQQAPPAPPNAQVDDDFIDGLLASFDIGRLPFWE